ncbi:hypothetical protein ACQPYK_42985 [Streptosporangium sp. CA-135522]|uniref:hypothetical protein n=1 Tax=Streptosporangium sp. CA-135522 TaxID=3240072 RepID=UPI003D8F0DA6
MSLGLSGAVLLAAAPFTASVPADAATRWVAAADPSEIPGCDPASGPCEEPTPVVTVTVTDNPEDTPPPTTPVPQKTVTTTVTVPPATKTPKPPKPPKSTTPVATTAPPVPLPTTTPVDPPPVVPPQTTASEEPEVVFPPNTEQSSNPLPSASPSASGDPTYEDVSPESAPYEIRNAGSEFDGATLSSQLAIPALILVLLVLFAVLIFEGRLRRLAHAAAIRRAGPRGPAHYRGDTMGYPAGPGYGPAPGFPQGPYQGGTAYAPIISFVPMQMYAPVYPEGYAPEQYPQAYEQQTAYPPQAGYEQPPAGYEQYGRPPTGHETAPYGPPGSDGVPPAPFHDPGLHAPGLHDPGLHGPGLHDSELHDPGLHDPGLHDPGLHDPGLHDPGLHDPGLRDRDASPAGSADAVPQGFGEFPGAPFPQEPPFVRAHSGESFPPVPDRLVEHPQPAGPDALPEGPGTHDDALREETLSSHGFEIFPEGPRPSPGFDAFREAGPRSSHGFEPTREDSLFLPPGHGPQRGPVPQGSGEFPGAPFPLEPPPAGDADLGSLTGQGPVTGPSPSEPTGTAVYPLPGQDSGKKKRGLFRRSK